MITQSELKEVLEYNPDTGLFVWKKNSISKKSGSIAGSKYKNGYIYIQINKKIYRAHRLAFLYMTGNFPENFIDHINHIRDDNRWTNLRDATLSQNQANRVNQKNNTSGYKGVSWNKQCKKWKAQISYMYKDIHIGLYTTPQEAAEAYKKKSIELFGKFSCTE
jgi:hypothetical protein